VSERSVWMPSRRLRIVCHGVSVLLIAALPMAGCATPAPAPGPADYPLHVAAPPVEIHWRLSVDANGARADGLVERRQHLIGSAWLQLLGLDATGRAVSFSPPIRVRWTSASDVEWFSIRLRPRGGEQRFEMRLFSFEYPEENTP
jgi:hypothetical protein